MALAERSEEVVGGGPVGLTGTPLANPDQYAFKLAVCLDLVLHSEGSPFLLEQYARDAEHTLSDFWRSYESYWNPPIRSGVCEECRRFSPGLLEVRVADSQIEDKQWRCPSCRQDPTEGDVK